MDYVLKIGKILVEGDVESELENIRNEFKKDIRETAIELGRQGKQYAENLADQKLPGRLSELYQNDLSLDIQENIVIIELKKSSEWIEYGRKSGFMQELLEGKSSKTSKDGKKYAVIPIEPKENTSTNVNNANAELAKNIKSFLRSQNVRYSKTRGLALNESGSPRIGKMSSFDIKDIRDKKSKSAQNLYGQVSAINVYQDKNPSTGKVERRVMAIKSSKNSIFRVITEDHKAQGKWYHPGTAPANILQETFEKIRQVFFQEVLPNLKRKYEGK
jgi:hypothetical protein